MATSERTAPLPPSSGSGRLPLAKILLSLASVLIVIGAWRYWRTPNLERPNSDFAASFHIGIGAAAPPDTRVFLELMPWGQGTTAAIVLGQSKNKSSPETAFRIELGGFLRSITTAGCAHTTAHTCWTGDATMAESESAAAATTLSGTFLPSGFTRIDLSPVSLGAARRGPYRSIYEEIDGVTDSALAYPTRGVEVEIASGVASTQSHYDSFFPSQAYRLYPDGWAWLLPAPGGPIGAQITDVEQEARIQRRAEDAGLIIGLFLALAIQIGYELMTRYLAPGRNAASGTPTGGPG